MKPLFLVAIIDMVTPFKAVETIIYAIIGILILIKSFAEKIVIIFVLNN